jgi:hypothetical protein
MSIDARSTVFPSRWRLAADVGGIEWDVSADEHLPHTDHVEMNGRHVVIIVRYAVDAERRLAVACEVIWPMLRTREGDVRGYTRRIYGLEAEPTIQIDDHVVPLYTVRRIALRDGVLIFEYDPVDGLCVTRSIYPSPDTRTAYQRWRLESVATSAPNVRIEWDGRTETATGVYGEYVLDQSLTGHPPRRRTDEPSKARHVFDVAVSFSAARADAVADSDRVDAATDFARRKELFRRLTEDPDRLLLVTPDPVFDAAFAFAKFRAAESLFETRMGLVHSPGGGRFYGGIWANDQAEYAGPLFGYLNDPAADEAALTAYRRFAEVTSADFGPLPSSLEMEGTIPFRAAGDRGDAAMIAGGASRYALARGDFVIAGELYRLVQWCLEYSRRKTNAAGVVESDSDELEGRFPTGTANLSTSCLAYDALRRGADLARAIDRPLDGAVYDRRAKALAGAIERTFGATVEGFRTYRYYDGNTTLRAWICLPLVFDLAQGERRSGTIAALFSPRLWTPDGLATEAGDTTFWDRSTLYALRGVFRAGATEAAFDHLSMYTRRRLLGEHVPYPVEAYPEGGQAHLSAESALYCRVITEGLFGITPIGLHTFTLAPYLPRAWPFVELSMHAFGHQLRIRVDRETDDVLRVGVLAGSDIVLDAVGPAGTTYTIRMG